MNRLIVAAIRCSLTLILPTVTYAISAEWDLDPISGDWNTAPVETQTYVMGGGNPAVGAWAAVFHIQTPSTS